MYQDDGDVIDVKPRPKFLTGTPGWMDNLVGRVALTLYGAAFICYWAYELLTK